MTGQIDPDGVYRIGGIAPDLSHELSKEDDGDDQQEEAPRACTDAPGPSVTGRLSELRRTWAALCSAIVRRRWLLHLQAREQGREE